jgi:hypothetical protein
MKKSGINGQMRNKLFLIVNYRFSLVKAALNAARVCKLRSGVNKTSLFPLFSMAKGRTKTIAHLSIVEGSSFLSLDRRIYACKLRNEKNRKKTGALAALLLNSAAAKFSNSAQLVPCF